MEQESSTTRRPPRKGDKRERILAAAIEVFARKGFYCAKVRDVARAAGVADGTIYLYFRNKDDLIIQVFEETMQRVIARLAADVSAGGSADERIRRFVAVHLDMVRQDPQLAEVITVELRQSSKFMKEYRNPSFRRYLEILADILEDGQRRGELREDLDAWLCARALFGMLDELVLTWVLGRRFDLDAAGRHVYEIFIRGIRSDADSRRLRQAHAGAGSTSEPGAEPHSEEVVR